jgi:DNA-binding response OmpR family regulator
LASSSAGTDRGMLAASFWRMQLIRESQRPPQRQNNRAGRPPRVLVVDDDAEMRRLVCDTLRKDHYDLVEETDGGRLLVRVAAIYGPSGAEEPVDLIVSDIRMPVCTGLDIVKGLRDARWGTPVVLMTAFADDDVCRRARSLNAVLFNKPFQMSDLRATVKALLDPGLAQEA